MSLLTAYKVAFAGDLPEVAQRVQGAIVRAAKAVALEPATAPNRTNRLKFAAQVLRTREGPRDMCDRMLFVVLTDPAVATALAEMARPQTPGPGPTDDQLQSAVAAALDAFAATL